MNTSNDKRKKALANFLKTERAKRRWSQRYVADQLQIAHTTIQKWEAEVTIADTASIEKIALLFAIHPWELFQILDKETNIQIGLDQILPQIRSLSSEDLAQLARTATDLLASRLIKAA